MLPPVRYGNCKLFLLCSFPVDLEEARQIRQRITEATQPDKLLDIQLPELEGYYREIYSTLGFFYTRDEYNETMRLLDSLRRDIELKRGWKQSAEQHQENQGQGATILYWTKWAVAVGVVVPILVALIQEIPFSKLLRAISSESQPQLIRTTKMILESPAPIEQPSVSPTESPTPSGATTPTETPIKFPPPAP